MLDNEIKDKVREIQHKYCGASVETKLYWAIKETIEKLNPPCQDCGMTEAEHKTNPWVGKTGHCSGFVKCVEDKE